MMQLPMRLQRTESLYTLHCDENVDDYWLAVFVVVVVVDDDDDDGVDAVVRVPFSSPLPVFRFLFSFFLGGM